MLCFHKNVFWLSCGFFVIIHVVIVKSCVVTTVDFFFVASYLDQILNSLSEICHFKLQCVVFSSSRLSLTSVNGH